MRGSEVFFLGEFPKDYACAASDLGNISRMDTVIADDFADLLSFPMRILSMPSLSCLQILAARVNVTRVFILKNEFSEVPAKLIRLALNEKNDRSNSPCTTRLDTVIQFRQCRGRHSLQGSSILQREILSDKPNCCFGFGPALLVGQSTFHKLQYTELISFQ